MKAIITAIEPNKIKLEYLCVFLDRQEEKVVTVPTDGGQVTCALSGAPMREKFGTSTDLMYWDGEMPFIDLIRQQYSAMRRHHMKFVW